MHCGRLLTEAMRLAFGTAKELAYAGGFSVVTAERYRRGEGYPDALTLTRLMGKSRVIAEAVLSMAGLDDLSLDQEQARLVRSLMELEQRRAARNADLAAAYKTAGVGSPQSPGAEARARRAAAAAADQSPQGATPPGASRR